jgi:hypothetical protein
VSFLCIAVSISIVHGVIEKRSSTAVDNTGTTIYLRLVISGGVFTTTVKPLPRLVNILLDHGVVWDACWVHRNSGTVEGDAQKNDADRTV